MKVCVLGAGAVGGIIAARLASIGEEVSIVECGPPLQAIRTAGLRFIPFEGPVIHVTPACTDDPSALGPQDMVFVCVKAYSLASVAALIPPLVGGETRVVFVQNGIPWWYFHGLEGPWRDHSLESLDPGGRLRAHVDPGRAIGCVAYVAAHVVEPGVSQSDAVGDPLAIGEPDGSPSEDCARLTAALERAGMNVKATDRIRDVVWQKLWGNLALNPLSVLTGYTFDRMCADPDLRALVKGMMAESQTIGERLGARFTLSMDKRLENAEALVGFRSSMLQDYEQGRPLETGAIVAVVSEMGRLVDVPTPLVDSVLALVSHKASTKD
jgi:2-dehydropantoate 2-reductase